MKLVIVESPTKAKTISQYLDKTFIVKASVGHIRDLPKNNKKAIDIPNGFVPHYEISKGKEKVVAELKELSKKASEVYLTTDPDREGEAIAWHIMEACDLKNPKRIEFHEITKSAVFHAMEHPRKIDQNLRQAQEARRVLDRLVGYDLSGLIWRKVRYGLSAGRVQSPALRIIMEREREIRAFVPEVYFVITGIFTTKKGDSLTLICDEEPNNEKEAERILGVARRAKTWSVNSIQATNAKRSPRPPFTTSTLQQSASSRLGFAPARTMSLAQKLYEQGLISYMRTDSVHMSQEALSQIYGVITEEYGKEYLSPRTYTTKNKHVQEAHEAVRPTRFNVSHAGSEGDQRKLYTLIRERALSSQMADAQIVRTKISAVISEKDGEKIPPFSATGSVVLFPGWLLADPRARGEDVEMPKVSEGETLNLNDISSERKETEPPSRYTEAALVKELEKRDIGRPSTYASIIKTLSEREYVTKEGKALRPTDTGEVVSSFLEKHFTSYISDSFTAEMEDTLDLIAEGKKGYEETLKRFYGPFSKEVKSKDKIEKVTNLGDADPQFICPLCKGGMMIKLARTGKFLSCKRFPDCTGARKLDGSELEGPKETGEMCPECGDGKLIERDGRYGRFIACSKYPKCKYIKKSPEEEAKGKTGVACPKCGKGEMVERRGRFGAFFSCSRYPECSNAIKARPTGKLCSLCDSLMMEGTKTIPERCSDKTCPNHNPHKQKADSKK